MEVEWKLLYEKRVIKEDIPALSSTTKKRIQQVIQTKLLKDPIYFGKPLQYSLKNQRSLRVGGCRVIYAIDLEKREISIHKIGHRREVYD